MRGLFISATTTGAGKTWLSRGLTRLAHRAGLTVAALKPLETGVELTPEDALALGRAAHRPELAFVPGLVRRKLAASPYAAQLSGEAPVDCDALLSTIHEAAVGSDLLLVEGAGGLFVPIDAHNTIADLVRALDLPLVLAAPNRLGVLSDVLATVRAARAEGLTPIAVVLTSVGTPDVTVSTNARILRAHLDLPIHELPSSIDDDDALATAAADAGLETLLGLGRPTQEDRR